jgi:hypothetical protein
MSLPALLRQILPEALDHDTFTITSQRPDSSFLSKTLMVVQTGADDSNGLISPATSRSVAIVDRTGNISEAAQSLVAARFALGGRSPYCSKYLAGENGEARQVTSTPRRTGVLDSIHKDRTARVLVSGSNWGVVEVQDR